MDTNFSTILNTSDNGLDSPGCDLRKDVANDPRVDQFKESRCVVWKKTEEVWDSPLPSLEQWKKYGDVSQSTAMTTPLPEAIRMPPCKSPATNVDDPCESFHEGDIAGVAGRDLRRFKSTAPVLVSHFKSFHKSADNGVSNPVLQSTLLHPDSMHRQPSRMAPGPVPSVPSSSSAPALNSSSPIADVSGREGIGRKFSFLGGANQNYFSCTSAGTDLDSHPQMFEAREEEEWLARQQTTGAAGRLVIYDRGDKPREDFMLRGGGDRRIMVSAVTDSGKAAQAGVKAGDVLVSINGFKDFQGKTADIVHQSLQAPIMMVFMGFVGKLQAEVRLKYKRDVCGLASQQQVAVGKPESPVKVIEETVFQPSRSSIFLTTFPVGHKMSSSARNNSSLASSSIDASQSLDSEDASDVDVVDIDTMSTAAVDSALGEACPENIPAVYELRGHEARKLLTRALAKVQPSKLIDKTNSRTRRGSEPSREQSCVCNFGGDMRSV